MVTGLTNGQAYTFTVTATNAMGTGAASAPSNSVTPTGGAAAAGSADERGGDWWEHDGDSELDGAGLERRQSDPRVHGDLEPGGLTATTPNGTTTTVVVTGLTNGTPYTFTVTATNANGTGPASAPSNAVTPGAGSVPSAPQSVAALAGNTTATVSWTPPASNGGFPITSYTVTSSPGGITATTLDGVTTSIVVPGLTNGVSCTFTVMATNALGTGPASAPSNAVVPGDFPGVVRSAHFRIGADTGVTAMQWRESTDTGATNLTWGNIFRVVMQVYNSGTSAKSWTPRLDVSTSSDSGYSALPTTAGAGPFYVYNSTQLPTNPTSIAVANFGLGSGTGNAQDGFALSYSEVEFSVFATNNAVQGQSYYFRITDNGTPFSSYDSGPALVGVGFPFPELPTPAAARRS